MIGCCMSGCVAHTSLIVSACQEVHTSVVALAHTWLPWPSDHTYWYWGIPNNRYSRIMLVYGRHWESNLWSHEYSGGIFATKATLDLCYLSFYPYSCISDYEIITRKYRTFTQIPHKSTLYYIFPLSPWFIAEVLENKVQFWLSCT